jgi:hypothetical protein
MSALRDTEPRAAGEERKVKKIKFSTSPFNSDAREEEEEEEEEELVTIHSPRMALAVFMVLFVAGALGH